MCELEVAAVWWQVTMVLNAIIAFCYLFIAGTIWRGLVRTGQLKTNPLGLATSAIFFSSALHHGSHSVHMLLPYLGVERSEGLAMRNAMGWHASVLDFAGATIAIWYLSLRGRYGALLSGPTMFADVKERQRRAVEINDDIVQGLTTVLYATELGDTATARAAADRALVASRKIISELVGGEQSPFRLDAGDLRRETPAVAVATLEPVPMPREGGQ